MKRTNLMDALNTPTITMLAIVSFVTIAWSSQQQHGYTKTERAAMDNLVASVTAPQTNAEKMLYLFGED